MLDNPLLRCYWRAADWCVLLEEAHRCQGRVTSASSVVREGAGAPKDMMLVRLGGGVEVGAAVASVVVVYVVRMWGNNLMQGGY